MIRVYSSNDVSEVEFVRNMLEKEGIECSIDSSLGASPFTDSFPQLWLLNDADFQRAHELVDQWSNPLPPGRPAWTCPDCGETIEGQFSTCWRCAMLEEQEDQVTNAS